MRERPTREQVDAALGHADLWLAGTSTPATLAAEVRALRDELGHHQRGHMDALVRAEIAEEERDAALAACTSQPASDQAAAHLDRLRVAPDGALWMRLSAKWARVCASPAWQAAPPDGSVPLVAPQPVVPDGAAA